LSQQYLDDPNVTIVVRQINSRKVFITGQVNKAGTYPLSGPTTVLQLIAMAGGIAEYAHGKKIVVMRSDNGRQVSFPFNYEEVVARKKLAQNIELRPGDTVIVP
jgi:polysaccharide export outer membrane protein